MRKLKVIFAILVWILGASPLSAEVRLELRDGDDGLRQALEAGSALIGGLDPSTPVADQLALARADYSNLLALLYAQGHFAPVVSVRIDGREAANLSPFAAPSRIDQVVITVTPGPRFRLGQAEIGPLPSGMPVPDGFATGTVATTGALRDVTAAVIAGWRAAGHATAQVNAQSITARNRDAVLDVAISIDPGPRLRFGPLEPVGQERMPNPRAIEIAGLPSGEIFDPGELDRAANRLRRTGAFSSVSLREGTPLPDGTLPITAELVEAPRRRLGFGAELSSTQGLGLSAYWMHRNLSGQGERLRFEADVTGIDQGSSRPDLTLSAAFSRPASATADTTFAATLSAQYLTEDTFREWLVEAQAGVEQQVTDRLVARGALGLRFSDVSDNLGDRQVTLVTLPLGLTYDSRNDPLDAADGVYGNLDLTPFHVLDTGDFGLRSVADFRVYRGFGESDRTRLAGRLQIGTLSGGTVADLPADYLFFSGGSGTVRGQDYRNLGALQSGQAAGGRSFAALSLELRQDLAEKLGAVAFFDAGYVVSGALWEDSGQWQSGAGLGLRYDTPVGAIRVDIAVPVEQPVPTSAFQLYIGIGQAF